MSAAVEPIKMKGKGFLPTRCRRLVDRPQIRPTYVLISAQASVKTGSRAHVKTVMHVDLGTRTLHAPVPLPTRILKTLAVELPDNLQLLTL